MSGNIAAQLGADLIERAAHAGCQAFHSGGCTKRDDSDNQSVFDQILTVLLRDQSPQLAGDPIKSGTHGLPRWEIELDGILRWEEYA